MKILCLLLMVCTAARLPAAIVSVTLPEPVRIDHIGIHPFDLNQDEQTDFQFVGGFFTAGLVVHSIQNEG